MPGGAPQAGEKVHYPPAYGIPHFQRQKWGESYVRAGDPNDDERWGEKEVGNIVDNEGGNQWLKIGNGKMMKKKRFMLKNSNKGAIFQPRCDPVATEEAPVGGVGDPRITRGRDYIVKVQEWIIL